MAALEVLALDTATPQIRAPGAADTYTMPRALGIAPGTVTVSAPALNLTQTWNAGAVTFTGALLNITNTASAAGSMLLDLQVGGASKLYVDANGTLLAQSNITAMPTGGLQVLDSGSNPSANRGFLVTNFSNYAVVNLASTWRLGWSSGTANTTLDLSLQRDAANTLAQRNGAAAQTSRLYGTFTDASNYRRVSQTMTLGGVATIAPEGLGTGAANNCLVLSNGSVALATLPTAAAAGAGARAFVSDASTTLVLGLGTTVVGGGANKVPIYSDGTNWIYG